MQALSLSAAQRFAALEWPLGCLKTYAHCDVLVQEIVQRMNAN
jgi:hypothetical protein